MSNVRRAPSFVEWLIIGAILGVLSTVFAGAYVLQIPLLLLIGWFSFLKDTVIHVQVATAEVALGIIALVLLVVGVQFFLHWLAPHRWRWRNSAVLVGLFLLMFVTSIAFTGAVHQLGWLFGDSVVVSDWELQGLKTRSMMNTLHSVLASHQQAHGVYPIANGVLPLEVETVDEWQRPLYYQSLDGTAYLLRSNGFDGVPGSGGGGFDDLILVDGQWLTQGRR